MTTGDTRRFGYAVGTFASRAAVMSGSAVALAARAVQAKALRVASDALECSADDLELIEGVVSVKGNPTACHPARPGGGAVQPAALRVRRGGAGGDPVRPAGRPGRPPVPEGTARPGELATTTRRRGRPSPPGCTPRSSRSIPDTARSRSCSYCVVHDCGTLINPMIVRGQVHGGSRAGHRRCAVRDAGLRRARPVAERVVHGLPDAVRDGDARRCEIDHQETPSPLNPLGIKGAGEAGVIPVSAVIASAIEDAVGLRDRRDADQPDRALRPPPGPPPPLTPAEPSGCSGRAVRFFRSSRQVLPVEPSGSSVRAVRLLRSSRQVVP